MEAFLASNELLKMRLKVDQKADALYFRLNETAIVESEEVQLGIILDYDKNGSVVGIEIFSLSSRIEPDNLRIFQFETI
ncbi:MAG: DUF2283 domain-containing protein [bacterium]